MARINEHYRKLQAGYLFPEIGRRVRAYSLAHPEARVIRLGIGDVTLPLAPAIALAMRDASVEMGTASGFRGYAPDNGYDFLIDAIREHDYRARGVEIAADEIFVSDGSKLTGKVVPGWDPPLYTNQDTIPRHGESQMKDFHVLNFGAMHLEKGRGLLTLRALEIPAKSVMDMRQVTLTLQK